MWSRSKTERAKTDRAAHAITATCLVGALLSGCSDPGLYLDRRDSIAFGAGDAVAANAAMQTVDPWPPESANTRLATNGQRMQSAVERYRTNTVTAPVDPMMLQVANPSPGTASNGNAQNGSSNSATTAGPNAAPTTTSSGTTGQ
jgi:hypothetical protein